MSAKAVWTGAISLGPVTYHVEATKAIESYSGKTALKEVCACHHKPFTTQGVCATSKEPRATEARVKEGKGGAAMERAVETAPDTFTVVPAAQLEAIATGISSPEAECIAFLDRERVPWHCVSGYQYLRPSKKVPGALNQCAKFYRMLEDTDRVVICKLGTRGKQNIVAIHVEDDHLVMNRLYFAQEVRTPEPEHTSVTEPTVDPSEVRTIGDMFDALLPDNLNLSEVEDESVAQQDAVIQAALAGEPAPTVEPGEPAPEPTVDLMAQMQAAIAAAGGAKPKKKAPAKARAKKVTA